MKIGNYVIAVSLLAALIFSSGLAAAQVGVESNTGNIASIAHGFVKLDHKCINHLLPTINYVAYLHLGQIGTYCRA